jgi:hypothetical protein
MDNWWNYAQNPMKTEFARFTDAMQTILRADPAAVKAAVDAEIQEHTAERKAKGHRKRGRKPKAKPSASGRVSTAKD